MTDSARRIESARVEVAEVLDDLDARPGSAASLLRTIVACYLRDLGGWIATTHLIELMACVGVPAPRARTAFTRAKAKGLLDAWQRDQVPGYRIPDAVAAKFNRGDRLLYEPRSMTDGDQWCLISFSVPESERWLRHQLRRRLAWIGCGTVSPALWICPEHLASAAGAILAELGLSDRATLFRADVLGLSGLSLPQALARWWDLDAIAALHNDFLRSHASPIRELGPDPSPERAFSVWTACVDSWRIVPHLDPGLPLAQLPSDWPGKPSTELFLLVRDTAREQATAYARAVAAAPLSLTPEAS